MNKTEQNKLADTIARAISATANEVVRSNLTQRGVAKSMNSKPTLLTEPVYQGFVFRSPPICAIGGGICQDLGQYLAELNVRHVFLVADQQVYQLGVLQPCEQAIRDAGLVLTIFSDIVAEPDEALVYRGIEQLKACGADMVLGAGGGSALDTAKAIAVLANYQGPLMAWQGAGLAHRSVRLGAIPTTAGTGSEVSDVTVIKLQSTGQKMVLKSPSLVPDLALLDADLTLKLPASVTAATGIDALTHAIEAYVSTHSNLLAKAYAYHAIETIFEHLPIAVASGQNRSARYAMIVAAYKAGAAFSNAGLGLTHAISHQLGSLLSIGHGQANAILLPAVMQFNRLAAQADYAELAIAMRVKRDGMSERQACDAAILATQQLIADLDLPIDLSQHLLPEAMQQQIGEQALQDPCLQGNPRQVTAGQIIALLKPLLTRPVVS